MGCVLAGVWDLSEVSGLGDLGLHTGVVGVCSLFVLLLNRLSGVLAAFGTSGVCVM